MVKNIYRAFTITILSIFMTVSCHAHVYLVFGAQGWIGGKLVTLLQEK
jgi:hypothetical protein